MALADFLYEKILSKFRFEPTECQLQLFKDLAAFAYNGGESDIMVINGYAGTGKTTAISAFISAIKERGIRYTLLAPTGRATKVLSKYSNERAFTIHKHIYRQKNLNQGVGEFSLDINKSTDRFYIVDEASLITNYSESSIFGTGDLLDDLITYVRQGVNCKLILIGDSAQLPPVGLDISPALDLEYLSQYGEIAFSELRSVVRQAELSGILHNATILRREIENYDYDTPKFEKGQFPDFEVINSSDLIESISTAYDKYGEDETIILCRTNKRANRYNNGIRSTVLFKEERLAKGDKLMIVKNCYQFLEDCEEVDFIANGDVAYLERISKYQKLYGLEFAQATLSFPDYNNIEIDAKIIIDTLFSESPALNSEQQNALFEGVLEDYAHITPKKKRFQMLREDKYFNAIQIKYANAITCHKSQGGQWKCVFIDNPFFRDELSIDDKKWLYTAITRGVEKVYLVNFPDNYFI